MATISENLSTLAEVKANIKTAIEAKGQDLTNVPFVDYATKIESIEIGEKKQTLYLPNAFSTCNNIYTFAVSEDIVLVSGDKNTSIGVWEYDLQTNICTQLWTQHYNYKKFQLFDDVCFVTSANGYLLLYDLTNRTIKSVLSTTREALFYIVKDFLFVAVIFNGVSIYQPETKSLRKIITTGGGEQIVTSIKDRVIFGASNANGLYVYDFNTGITTTFQSNTSGWVNCIVVGDNALISNSSSNTSTMGVFLYDYETNTLTQLYDQQYDWNKGYDMGDGNGLLCSSRGDSGIVYFDGSTKTITQVYSVGGQWGTFQDIGEDILIGASKNSSYARGVLSFNKATKEVTVMFSDSSSFGSFYLLDDVCIIGAWSGSGSMGLLVYDRATKTATRAISQGGEFIFPCDLDNVVLIVSSMVSYYGVWEYDKTTRAIRKLTEFGRRFDTFNVSDKAELYSSQDKVGVTYDPATKTITSLIARVEV